MSRKTRFLYLIACSGETALYLKIGKTNNLYSRIANIQTGCPYKIRRVFVVTSLHEEEILGLEKLLHRKLSPLSFRGEWYLGTEAFYNEFEANLAKINSGSFSWSEIDSLPDLNAGPELEIMLHPHDFRFVQVDLPIRKTFNGVQHGLQMEPKDMFSILRESI